MRASREKPPFPPGGGEGRDEASACATHVRPLLDVRNLRVEFPTRRGVLTAVDDVSFAIAPGEVLGVVGESGAGKSLTGAAIIGLLEPPGRIARGEILLDGMRIDHLPHDAMRRIRGRRIGAIFQDPLASLDPLYSIGRQLTETIRTHLPMSDAAARLGVIHGQVRLDRLDDLVTDRVERVQRRERILEDRADAPAADPSHRLAGKVVDALALEADLAARDAPRALQQSDDGGAGDRLARTRFADDAQHLARRDLEAHVVHRDQRSAPSVELDAQMPDLQQRSGHFAPATLNRASHSPMRSSLRTSGVHFWLVVASRRPTT